jgi:hypothetical protein
MDTVISVDTSVAHLAGALGKPTWVLLPHVPDWRWLLERDDSPWYDSVKLYRQAQDRQWSPVLGQVASDLLQTSAVAQHAVPKTVYSPSQKVAIDNRNKFATVGVGTPERGAVALLDEGRALCNALLCR